MLKGSRIWHLISFSFKGSALAGAMDLMVGSYLSSTLSCSLLQLSVPFSHSVHNLYPPPFCVFAFSLYFSSSVIYQLPNQLWILFDSILGPLASHHVLALVVRSVTSLVLLTVVPYAVHVVSLNPCFHCFLFVYSFHCYNPCFLFFVTSLHNMLVLSIELQPSRFFFGGEFSHHSAQEGNKTEVSLLQLLGWFLNLSKKVSESLMFEEMDVEFTFLLHPKFCWHFGTVWRKPWIVIFLKFANK